MLVKDLGDAGDGPYCVARNTSAELPTKISLPRVRLAFRMLKGKIADGPAGQMRGRRLGVNYEYDSEN